VQGHAYDRAAGTFGTTLQGLAIPLDSVEPPQASSVLTLAGNLDADSEPLGSLLRSRALYDATGAAATRATVLRELYADTSGADPLLAAGDVLTPSATVGGEAVTAEIVIGTSTTVGNWIDVLESMLNSPAGVSGLTVTLEETGRLTAASPADAGETAEIGALQLGVADDSGAARPASETALRFNEVQSARDAGAFVTEASVCDALGNVHRLRFAFTRLPGTNEFQWQAEVSGAGVEILEGASGRARFAADGSLAGLTFDAEGGRAPQALQISIEQGAGETLSLSLAGGTVGAFDGLTMFAGESTLQGTADGLLAGEMLSFEIDAQGQLMALFSNGVSRPVGRLVLAEFINPGGLTRVGDNAYLAGNNSGTARLGAVGEGIASTVSPGALEQSNVDLAREFTDMIVAQRGFQANARVITASDEVLTELINVKR